MMHIRKDDTVFVNTGKVIKIFTGEKKALVQGINFLKKHQRRTQQDQQGGIIQKEMPIHISNQLLVCPKCNKPTRSKVNILGDGSKLRSCVKCKDTIA